MIKLLDSCYYIVFDCQECEDECEKRGQTYFWCNRKIGGWGYCSPNTVYNALMKIWEAYKQTSEDRYYFK